MSKTPKNKRTSARPTRSARAPAPEGRGIEVGGVVALGVALFVTLAMIALQVSAMWMGPFGRWIASLVYGIGGLTSYALVALFAASAVRVLLEKKPVVPLEIGLGTALGALSLATLLHLAADDYRVNGIGPGGALGEHAAEILRALISTAGTALLASLGLAIAIIIGTPLRMRQVLGWIGDGARFVGGGIAAAAQSVARFVADVIRAIMPEREHEHYPEERDEPEDDPFELDEKAKRKLAKVEPPIIDRSGRVEAASVNDTEKVEAAIDAAIAEPVVALKEKKPRKPKTDPVALPAAAAAVALPPPPPPAPPVAAAANAEPVIVESRFKHADPDEMAKKEQQAEAERRGFIKLGDGAYELPPIHLLKYDAQHDTKIDKAGMLELSARLTQTLSNYGVKGDVVAIRPGPVVTMYEFAPAPGTRVSKISNLSDDLAMALEALRVRIVAPIPGKAAVGIEVPNRAREKVFLKEIIADDVFAKSKAKLPMAIGKDIEGGPSVVDLARMPHLLVAGTTGSGKSVAVNAMITSLLYNCTPEECRMIMVDPKMLELSIYEGVPHLLLPVVTDPKKANLALRWAVDEMERRYDLLAQMGVRDIATYNEKIAKKAEPDPTQTKLPFIVVVIDEFADLMMCAPKEVETSVARIAQKARAAGIHLILATQRPSVDVITGLIKANFPSRIAFHVASKIDSRTILDQGGAEALLGAGDMLFSDRGAAPTRLHGCYVDEDEIHQVVDFLKTQGRPVYNLDILKPREEEQGDGGEFAVGTGVGGDGKGDDAMYDKAVHIVTTTRNASISWVQRQLRIGYNRAARLVEEMEKQGVVSPPDHTNKREVLVAAA